MDTVAIKDIELSSKLCQTWTQLPLHPSYLAKEQNFRQLRLHMFSNSDSPVTSSVVDPKLFFWGSGFNLTFRSGLFMKNTFELQICSSSKHCKKAIVLICIFLDLDCWWKIHMNCKSSKHRKKANFLKSVHFYSFLFVSWKQNLILTRIRN
jgi:hypothetical protein